jgi:hemoglobin-like flavoprotein
MTPEQIRLVQTTLEVLDLESVTAEFYRRAFAADPGVALMFTTDKATQQERFAAELRAIVTSIREHEVFLRTTHALGVRHAAYGVHARHYRLMGDALLGALAGALGADWTPDLAEAWTLAYNLTAEAMMEGASP